MKRPGKHAYLTSSYLSHAMYCSSSGPSPLALLLLLLLPPLLLGFFQGKELAFELDNLIL